jgi:hypothetical protein
LFFFSILIREFMAFPEQKNLERSQKQEMLCMMTVGRIMVGGMGNGWFITTITTVSQ